MNFGRTAVLLAAGALLALGAVSATAATTVQVTNHVDGATLRYPLALVSGVYDGQALQIAAVPANAAVSFTTYGTRFRCLVDLQPGTNTLTLTDNHGPVVFNLAYVRPSATNWHHKVWYVVPADEAAAPADTNWFVHFGLQTKLMQSWMAEDQLRAGNGRVTFYPELDASNNVNVGLLVLSQTRAQAEALGGGSMYGQVWNQIPAAYRDGTHKNVTFTTVAYAALGGGDLAYVGAYQNFLPDRASDIMAKLLSTTTYGSDSLTFATYCGVTLHEMVHCIHSIWHDFSANNVMGGAYDISQYFTLTYSAANFTPHNESSAATLGNVRDLAHWHRSLMSADPHVYTNATVGITIGSEYIVSTSANPLAIFQYYLPSTGTDLHTNLYALGVKTFSKHIGGAYQELGSSPFNVMTVDTEGNMSYTSFSGTTIPVLPVDDTYDFEAGIPITVAAPGVLGNDVKPGGGALTSALATNVLHGTVVLSANGGFTYTPVNGYSGTDTFWYAGSDSVSSDRVAKVTLRMSTNGASAVHITPWPKTVVVQTGTFVLSAGTKVVPATPALQALATVLTNELKLAYDLTVAVDTNGTAAGKILLQLSSSLSNEAYRVTVTAVGAVVEAGNYAALAAASMSLLQSASYDGTQTSFPCMSVNDAPFVPYRGLMIDCARQLHSVATLKQIIQLCRLYKIRYLQLHLTDDQGFMFPSTAYPLLNTQNQSGPAYTLAELRDLERYSQDRGVTIIPELEIPGHEAAMNRAMPDLFKIKDTLPYEHHATINWAKADVTNALDVLIGEICSVFQATPYFHIGGDEADFVYAHQNTNFIQRFQELGYALPYDSGDTYQLYRRLLRNLSGLITTKYGKQMLCWEGFQRDQSAQPLEPIPHTIPVMAFENTYYPANTLAADGYPVINTAWNPLYVVNGTQCSPENIYGWNLYRFGRYQPDWNQVTWITVPTNSPQVIGAQMCSWEQPENIELSSLRLRLAAMSERIWNPGAGKTYADFSNRVVAADALLSQITQTGAAAPFVNVGGNYDNPNVAPGAAARANMTNNTTFGWQTGTCAIPVQNNGYTFTLDSGNGNDLNYGGAITGTGTVRFLMGPWSPTPYWTLNNPLRLTGAQPNTIQGTYYAAKGRVQLEKSDGVAAISGNIIVGGQGDNDGLFWAANDQIIDIATVSLLNSAHGGAYLDLNGHTETITALSMAATAKVATGNGGVLTVSTLTIGSQSYGGGTYTTLNSSFVTGSGSVVVVPPITKPALPAGLTATATNLLVTLRWNVVTNATGYNVKRSLVSNVFNTVIGGTSGSATTNYPDTQVTNGVLYWYVVSATNSAGESTNSAAVSARPLPATPPTPVYLTSSGASSGISFNPAMGATLRFNAMGGIKYWISYRDDLRSGSWTNLDWQTCTNNGTAPMVLMDSGATNRPQRYYRIGAQKP